MRSWSHELKTEKSCSFLNIMYTCENRLFTLQVIISAGLRSISSSQALFPCHIISTCLSFIYLFKSSIVKSGGEATNNHNNNDSKRTLNMFNTTIVHETVDLNSGSYELFKIPIFLCMHVCQVIEKDDAYILLLEK